MDEIQHSGDTVGSLADFLVVCVGRVGTNSITNAFQDHPDIAHVFANNATQTQVCREKEQNPSARIGIIGHHVQDFEGPLGLPAVANSTTRQTLIHVVRDPLPHVCARYNQLVWNEAYAIAYTEHLSEDANIGPPLSIHFDLPDFDTFARHSDWMDVQYHSYRERFGRFEQSLTVDFEEFRPGAAFTQTLNSIFGALGVKSHLNSWTSDVPSGSKVIHSLVRTPLGKQPLEIRIGKLDINGWAILVPDRMDPDFDRTFQISKRKNFDLLVELPCFLDAVGAPLEGHHLCLVLSCASNEISDIDTPKSVLKATKRYVQECWAPDWIRILNRTQALFDVRNIDEIPQTTESYLRALFAEDVDRLYQEYPRLSETWTF